MTKSRRETETTKKRRLSYFDVQSDGDWRVLGLFVVDEPLFLPHLRHMDMTVLALEELRAASGTQSTP